MSIDDGFMLNFMDEDDATASDDTSEFWNLNQTALSILYEKIKTARACLEHDFEDSTRCEEGALYRGLMGYAFLVLCVIAVVGNCFNVLVYLSEQIRFFIAIRMLCTKLIVNTLTMLCLIPQALRSINLWEAGSVQDQIYWKLWPYHAFFVNVFGFVGIWMTVLMTTEIYVHIFLPLQSKLICTKNNLMRSYMVITLIAILLAGIYPLNRLVVLRSECNSVVVTISVADSYFLGIYERFHMTANLLFAIIIPLVLLVLMSVAIVWRLNTPAVGKPSTSSNGSSNVGRFGSEKRTVVRITLITTLLQLFSELPSVPVFIFAALYGPSTLTTTSNLCFWQTISQFVAIFNVSLSFFTYLLFSPRFREAIVSRLCGSAPQKSRVSSPSKRLSNTRLDEVHLLTPRMSETIKRNESAGSADNFKNPTNVTRYLSISSNTTAVTNDVFSSISKNSDTVNFL